MAKQGDHVGRAAHHRLVGDALADATGEEWAAVCYFYSAYHLIRDALLNDPVFDDQTRLEAVHSDLVRDDRKTTRHNGRQGRGREWGINELVHLLYPNVVGRYEALHQMSIAVRYNGGLKVFTAAQTGTWLEHIEAERAAGKLVN